MTNDFRPTAAWPLLELRAAMLARLRQFFLERGFLEVETPLLSHDVVVDRHLDPLAVEVRDLSGGPQTLWLQTSPEAGMKRLLAAARRPMFQIAKAFRGGERGQRHNPEFTLVEWYRPGDTMHQGIELLAALAETMLGPTAGFSSNAEGESPRYEQARTSAEHGVRQLSYGEAFAQHVGVDPHTAAIAELRDAATTCGLAFPQGASPHDRDAWLDLLLTERVEPNLGPGPVILYDYPASQAALAQVRPGAPPVAERFELYAGGVELANGYHELLDAEELARRDTAANAARRADGKSPLPGAARLLAAMQAGLPDCTGVALGFDRLVMVAAGAKTIDDVIPFPIERA